MKRPDRVMLPASVDIDLTNHCNQDCYYCESADFRQRSTVSGQFDDYMLLLDRLSQWRQHSPNSMGTTHTVCFSGGGEPTLFKGYELIIERSIDLGFQTSLITNGVNLNHLMRLPQHKLQQMAWVGVDLDAGNQVTYELIRKTSGASIFERVLDNISQLTRQGVAVDIKVLLNEYNGNLNELQDIFQVAKQHQARQVYFRPTVIKGRPWDFHHLLPTIQQLSEETGVATQHTLKKFQPRTYNRCHQMYQFVVFCPDGKMYSCCENKGNPDFSIGDWTQNDFRDLWLNSQHDLMYNSINTKLCAPCRSHHHNLAIQSMIDNPQQLDSLFY